jgi:hypothetical protein
MTLSAWTFLQAFVYQSVAPCRGGWRLTKSAGIFEPVDGNRIVAEMQGFSAIADV